MLAPDRLARQAVLADERGRLRRRRRGLRAGEPLDEAWETVRRAAADDPLEQRRVLIGDLERRVAGAHRPARVGEAEEVAVRDALTPAVLDRLMGELVRRALRVPRADRAAQPTTPATELLDEGRELEQVRAGAADVGQRGERGASPRRRGRPPSRARTRPGRSSARGPRG